MLFRQKPLDTSKYIKITDKLVNKTLQIEGFYPKYLWEGVFYYKWSDALEKFLEKGGMCGEV